MLDKIKQFFVKEQKKIELPGIEPLIVYEFPKIKRLPWSGGVSLLSDVSNFLERDLVILEKIRGIDVRFDTQRVLTKENQQIEGLTLMWDNIKKDIPTYWQLFGTYNSGSFILHSIRINPDNDWVSWSDVMTIAKSFNLGVPTKFWGGSVDSEKELQELTLRLMRTNNYKDLIIRDRHHFLNINNSVTKMEA